MGAKPTGHYLLKADGLYLQFDRLFRAPIEDVWFSLTNPGFLERWIGTYTGLPSTGAVRFKMTAEDPDAPWMNVSILECEAPHRFSLDIGEMPDSMRLSAHLLEAGGMTTLSFAHRLHDAKQAVEYGPGWDYYLDRLDAAREDRPLPDWEAYASAFDRHYKELHVPDAVS
ncbi:SRPBCC family protein [Agromyces protaetiae]|nr:SRPBCC family protein [Agromyces protaetiae]